MRGIQWFPSFLLKDTDEEFTKYEANLPCKIISYRRTKGMGDGVSHPVFITEHYGANCFYHTVETNRSSTITGVSEKILELARKQRMNTDVRRNIFCVIMTSEVHLILVYFHLEIKTLTCWNAFMVLAAYSIYIADFKLCL